MGQERNRRDSPQGPRRLFSTAVPVVPPGRENRGISRRLRFEELACGRRQENVKETLGTLSVTSFRSSTPLHSHTIGSSIIFRGVITHASLVDPFSFPNYRPHNFGPVAIEKTPITRKAVRTGVRC